MTYRLHISRAANKDLAQIWEHHAEMASIKTADAVIARIRETIDRVICLHPLAGRSRPELGHGLRSLPIVPFIVFYKIEPRKVQIIRVLHSRRDIQRPLISLLAAV